MSVKSAFTYCSYVVARIVRESSAHHHAPAAVATSGGSTRSDCYIPGKRVFHVPGPPALCRAYDAVGISGYRNSQ